MPDRVPAVEEALFFVQNESPYDPPVVAELKADARHWLAIADLPENKEVRPGLLRGVLDLARRAYQADFRIRREEASLQEPPVETREDVIQQAMRRHPTTWHMDPEVLRLGKQDDAPRRGVWNMLEGG